VFAITEVGECTEPTTTFEGQLDVPSDKIAGQLVNDVFGETDFIGDVKLRGLVAQYVS